MIIKGKHTDYIYTTPSNVIIALTDTGYNSKSEYIYLAEDSRNPVSVLSVVMDYERYYA